MYTHQNLEQRYKFQYTHVHTPEFRSTDKGVQYTHVHTPEFRTNDESVQYTHVHTHQNLELLIKVSNINMYTHTPEFRTTDKGVQYTHVHTPEFRTTDTVSNIHMYTHQNLEQMIQVPI
jgi:hypothetical protein